MCICVIMIISIHHMVTVVLVQVVQSIPALLTSQYHCICDVFIYNVLLYVCFIIHVYYYYYNIICMFNYIYVLL
jgi:hypothetical protein